VVKADGRRPWVQTWMDVRDKFKENKGSQMGHTKKYLEPKTKKKPKGL
jgi:hypothetical protein